MASRLFSNANSFKYLCYDSFRLSFLYIKNMLLKIIKESDGGAHKKVIYDEIASTNSVKHRS